MNDTRVFNKTTLGFLLAVQVVLVGVLLAAQSGAVVEPEAFLSLDTEQVDSISISNADDAVSLRKADGAWRLPDGLPVDASKIDGLLDKLGNAAGGWPVASKASTAERFEVTEDNHQRHVVLNAGDDVAADFYLGTSPGYRKAHARHVDEDEVYAITFSNYEAGVRASDWLDKSLLRPVGTLSRIDRASDGDEVDDFSLLRVLETTAESENAESAPTAGEASWTSSDGAVLVQSKVDTFVGRFTNLSVLGVSDADLPASPKLTFTLTDTEGAQRLDIYHLDAGDDYVVVSDRVPGRYEMSSYIAEQLVKPFADLTPEPPETELDLAEVEEVLATDESAGTPPDVANGIEVEGLVDGGAAPPDAAEADAGAPATEPAPDADGDGDIDD